MANRVKRTQQTHPSGSLSKGSTILTTVGTGVAIAILESDLVPGMLLGAAAVLLPKLEPGGHTHTIVKRAIRSRLRTRIKSRGIRQEGLLATAISAAAVAVIEPELLPGMAVGAAVSLLPEIMPVAQKAVWPIIKTSVKAGYITVRETRNLVLNVGEQLQEIVTEVRDEQKEHSLAGN